MSYRSYAGQQLLGYYTQDFFPTTPMLNDIATIQHYLGLLIYIQKYQFN